MDRAKVFTQLLWPDPHQLGHKNTDKFRTDLENNAHSRLRVHPRVEDKRDRLSSYSRRHYTEQKNRGIMGYIHKPT